MIEGGDNFSVIAEVPSAPGPVIAEPSSLVLLATAGLLIPFARWRRR